MPMDLGTIAPRRHPAGAARLHARVPGPPPARTRGERAAHPPPVEPAPRRHGRLRAPRRWRVAICPAAAVGAPDRGRHPGAARSRWLADGRGGRGQGRRGAVVQRAQERVHHVGVELASPPRAPARRGRRPARGRAGRGGRRPSPRRRRPRRGCAPRAGCRPPAGRRGSRGRRSARGGRAPMRRCRRSPACSRIRAPTSGWRRISRHSASSSAAGLCRIASAMPSLPRSCSTPAAWRRSTRSGARPSVAAVCRA